MMWFFLILLIIVVGIGRYGGLAVQRLRQDPGT